MHRRLSVCTARQIPVHWRNCIGSSVAEIEVVVLGQLVANAFVALLWISPITQ